MFLKNKIHNKLFLIGLFTCIGILLFWFLVYYRSEADVGIDRAFKYGLSPEEIEKYTEKAKLANADADAAYAMTVHYSSQEKYTNPTLEIEWAWYTLYIADSSMRLDRLEELTYTISRQGHACPKRSKSELDSFLKHWSQKEPSSKFKAQLELFKLKCHS